MESVLSLLIFNLKIKGKRCSKTKNFVLPKSDPVKLRLSLIIRNQDRMRDQVFIISESID